MRSKLKSIIKKTRASVLGSVVLIGSSAVALVFSFWVMSYSDNKIINQKEDSLLAYHSASAGIELGLMYYKFNKNVQLAAKCQNVNSDCPEEPTKTRGLPVRIYIDRLGCADRGSGDQRDMSKDSEGKRHCFGVEVNDTVPWEPVIEGKTKKPPADEQVVDLKIWYKDDQLGDPTKFNENLKNPNAFNSNYNYNPEISRVVQQDDTYQIDGLENVRSFRIHLRPKEWAEKRDEFIDLHKDEGLKPEDPKVYDKSDYRKWFQKSFCHQLDEPRGNLPAIQADFKYKNLNDLCAYYIIKIPNSAHPTAPPLKNEMLSLRFPFEYLSNGYLVKLNELVETIRLRPINMDMQLAITDVRNIPCHTYDEKNPDCNAKIDSGVTHIEATGYHGSVKRKLEAKYDRKDNSFLGIFDRALYVSEGGLMAP